MLKRTKLVSLNASAGHVAGEAEVIHNIRKVGVDVKRDAVANPFIEAEGARAEVARSRGKIPLRHHGWRPNRDLQKSVHPSSFKQMTKEQHIDAEFMMQTAKIWSQPGRKQGEVNWDLPGAKPVKSQALTSLSTTRKFLLNRK